MAPVPTTPSDLLETEPVGWWRACILIIKWRFVQMTGGAEHRQWWLKPTDTPKKIANTYAAKTNLRTFLFRRGLRAYNE